MSNASCGMFTFRTRRMNKLVPLLCLAMIFARAVTFVSQETSDSVLSGFTSHEESSSNSHGIINNDLQDDGKLQTTGFYTSITNYKPKQRVDNWTLHTEMRYFNKRTRDKTTRENRTAMLEQGKQCLQWVPTLNITTVAAVKNLMVDYCRPDGSATPNTTVCFLSQYSSYCATVVAPSCGYTFENVSTGDITISIEVNCDICFDSIIYNRKCPSVIFEKKESIVVESSRLRGPDERGPSQADSSGSRSGVIAGCSLAGLALACILVVIICVRNNRRTVPPPNPLTPEMIDMAYLATSNPSTFQDREITSHFLTYREVVPTSPISHPSGSETITISHLQESTSPGAEIIPFLPTSDPRTSPKCTIIPLRPTSNSSTSSQLLPKRNPSISSECTIIHLLSTSDTSESPDVKIALPIPTSILRNNSEKQAAPNREEPQQSDPIPQDVTCYTYTLDFYFSAFFKEFERPPGPSITLTFDIPYALIQNENNKRRRDE